MAIRLIICFLLFGYSSAQGMLIVSQKSWGEAWRGKASVEQDVQSLMLKLSQSQVGKKLIALGERKAANEGQRLVNLIGEGSASYTDFTLQREMSGQKIKYNKSRKIVIDRNTSVKRAVHDLAHELVHFIWQDGVNPFDHQNHFSDYLKKNLEGKGGEVDAFMVECKVARQLHPQSWEKQYPCKHITESGKISRNKTVQAFYKVGDRKELVSFYLRDSSQNFPYLSEQAPVVIAGISSQAYPFSMLQEFREMRSKVCDQEKERLGRSPASEQDKKQVAALCEY